MFYAVLKNKTGLVYFGDKLDIAWQNFLKTTGDATGGDALYRVDSFDKAMELHNSFTQNQVSTGADDVLESVLEKLKNLDPNTVQELQQHVREVATEVKGIGLSIYNNVRESLREFVKEFDHSEEDENENND